MATDRWARWALVPLALLLLAGGLRLVGLGTPDRLYFDEKFYADDAHQYLERGVERDRPAHPPLGKWLIAAGIAALGFDPVGWRVAAALAGTAAVLLTYVVGWRLFRSALAAALAATLFAVDGLALTMSRLAMLDAFLMLFVVAGVALLILDHERTGRTWRLLAGVAFGCAVATKWSGVLALGVAVLLVVGLELAVAGPGRSPPGGRARRILSGVVLPLVVVPFAVYLLSWTGWFANYERTETGRDRCDERPCAVGVADLADAWIDEQVELFRFQRRLEATHEDRSSPWEWPLLTRPVLFYLEGCEDGAPGCSVVPGNQARILNLGNPAVWWPGMVAVALVAWVAVRRRAWPALVVAGFALGQYVPWFASWKTGFSFYLLPATPFVCLALGWVVWRLRRPVRVPAALTLVALAVAGLLYFRPLWYGEETPASVQRERTWFDTWR